MKYIVGTLVGGAALAGLVFGLNQKQPEVSQEKPPVQTQITQQEAKPMAKKTEKPTTQAVVNTIVPVQASTQEPKPEQIAPVETLAPVKSKKAVQIPTPKEVNQESFGEISFQKQENGKILITSTGGFDTYQFSFIRPGAGAMVETGQNDSKNQPLHAEILLESGVKYEYGGNFTKNGVVQNFHSTYTAE